VSSQVGVGSVFSITLSTEHVEQPSEEDREAPSEHVALTPTPVRKAVTAKNPSTPVKPVAPTGPSHKVMNTKRQILLIEDNPDVVDQFRRILQREGYEIFTATIPLEAEAMASGLHPTVVVMDVAFAGGKGWDILKSIKERDDTYDIPIVVATLSDEFERATESGAFRFVQRPFTPEQLVEAVLDAETESRTERILIIDDQPDSVQLLKQVLDLHGKYRIFAANNGVEGISMVARRRPDLILLDLRMPDMDGFAVLDELRANPETSTIPVVVITSDSVSADEQQRLDDVRVIYKTDISPDNSHQFIDSVQAHLTGLNGGNE
jgi:CheY-like chemotaxis protein